MRGGDRLAEMELCVDPDPAHAAAARIARRLRDAVRRRGGASLALSGGSTTPPMIAALLDADVPWDAVRILQVDERIAPDGDDDRNANQLAGLARVAHVDLLPVTATGRRAAARRYAARLPDPIDVVHLGIGSDGHTASWPPGRDDVIVSPRSVELVGEFHGRERMTLTGRVVNGARCRVVLATGSEKRPVVERWLEGDRSLPIAHVRRSGTWVHLDAAAAPEQHGRIPVGNV